MRKVHDRGGQATKKSIDVTEHALEDWERRTDALQYLLARKGITSTDELRRAIESLPPRDYESFSYYQRWATGIETLLIEKGLLTKEEIDREAGELVKEWSKG